MSKEKNPFDNTDYNKAIPIEWNSTLVPYCRYFRCKLPIFRHLLANEVPTNVKAKVSKAWVIIANRRIAAYATYRADLLQIIDSKGRAKKIILENAAYTSVPAIKIQLLAADIRANGAGFRLLDWLLDYIVREIVPRVAVRFITVDAYYTESGPDGKPWDSSTFYRDKFDFRYIDPNETLPPKGGYRSMYLDLLPLIEGLEGKRSKKSDYRK